MHPRLGIPASGLLPLAVVAFELTLGATAYGWVRAVACGKSTTKNLLPTPPHAASREAVPQERLPLVARGTVSPRREAPADEALRREDDVRVEHRPREEAVAHLVKS